MQITQFVANSLGDKGNEAGNDLSACFINFEVGHTGVLVLECFCKSLTRSRLRTFKVVDPSVQCCGYSSLLAFLSQVFLPTSITDGLRPQKLQH
jgi:hypothetical protein